MAKVGSMVQAKGVSGVVFVSTMVPIVNSITVFRIGVFRLSNFEISERTIFALPILLSKIKCFKTFKCLKFVFFKYYNSWFFKPVKS